MMTSQWTLLFSTIPPVMRRSEGCSLWILTSDGRQSHLVFLPLGWINYVRLLCSAMETSASWQGCRAGYVMLFTSWPTARVMRYVTLVLLCPFCPYSPS